MEDKKSKSKSEKTEVQKETIGKSENLNYRTYPYQF